MSCARYIYVMCTLAMHAIKPCRTFLHYIFLHYIPSLLLIINLFFIYNYKKIDHK